MLNINKLRGLMAEKGATQKDLAKWLNLSENTVSKRMQTGVFGTDELEIICEQLGVPDVRALFLRL